MSRSCPHRPDWCVSLGRVSRRVAPVPSPSLVAVGLLYNLGIWADKFMFWFFPPTSQPIIGALRASLIYDLPVFLSYLSIIPGMAVFLVRIETDFVE